LTLDDLRGRAEAVTEPLSALAERTGVSPNQLSILSLAFAIAASVLYYLSANNINLLYAAALAVLLNATFDVADGSLARRTGRANLKGDFLDHAIDRYADMFLLGGIIFAGYAPWAVGLLTVIGVFLTSYMGTQAQALQIGRYYGGILGRADRLALIFLATIGNALYSMPIAGLPILGWVLVATMISSHITALQRFRFIWNKL
jgi:phosphatidylglycerophosphate synthase